jgi:hypothetical protein
VPAGGDTAPLSRFQDQAVATVMQQYQLPDSDRSLVLPYARNELRWAVFAQVIDAFKTPEAKRTSDQQFLVDGYSRLVREKRVRIARAAINEYNKWNADPCGYTPPPGYTYQVPGGVAACRGINRALSSPRSPEATDFVDYGLARVLRGEDEASAGGYKKATLADPQTQTFLAGTSEAAAIGYGTAIAVGTIATAAGIGAVTASSVVALVIPFATKVFASGAGGLVGGALAATGAAIAGAFAIAAIIVTAIAIPQWYQLQKDAGVLPALQELVNTVGTQTVLSCLSTSSTASTDQCQAEQKEVFADVVLSTLPDYQGNDPAPSAEPGSWVQYTAADGSQRSFHLMDGPWFADRADSTGEGIRTLSIKYCTGGDCASTDDSKKQSRFVSSVGNMWTVVRPDLPTDTPQRSTSLSILDWSGNTVNVQYPR